VSRIPGHDLALEFSDIICAYGHRPVLRGVSLRLRLGQSLAIMGANGAGKTTVLRVAAMLMAPSGGRAAWFGMTPAGPAIRQRIGFVAHESLLYDSLTLRENLEFFAGLYGVARGRVPSILEQMGLESVGDRRVRLLSRGQRQRANLARALLHDPDLLILDEPFTGLDRDAHARLALLLREDAGRRAVLWSTHNVEDIRAVANGASGAAVLLQNGRLTEAPPGPGSGPQATPV
jgi:heme exporter protein A